MKIALCALAALCVAAASVQSQTQRKPGLWEVQSKHSGAGMPNMEEMLAKVPPAQRAQVEQMMKQQGAGTGGAPNSFRYCLTPERAAKEMVPASDPDTQCEHKMGARAGSEQRFSFTCKSKNGNMVEGDGRSYDVTPESYALDMNMKTVREGKPMQMRMEQRGRWLGADCKGLKPLPG
jgi:Spy/CpxP family protein refolding chaperone